MYDLGKGNKSHASLPYLMGQFTLQPEINFRHLMVTYAHSKPNIYVYIVYDIYVVF